jgi:hypothetical protein
MKFRHSFAFALSLVASSAAADGKKAEPSVDDLFGTPPASSSIDKLKKAADKDKSATNGNALAPKETSIDEAATVILHAAFAAEKIAIDKKLGCQPVGKNKKKILEWTFNEVPQTGVPFSVCLTIQSKIGRQMTMSVAVVDPRNNKIVRGEDTIDFSGRAMKIDHILDYPVPMFSIPGEYTYVVTLDGKEVGRLPLFVVKSDSVRPDSAR